MSVVDTATAEAVAVYFLQLYPYVYATGDLTEWRELSHPECIFCASVVTNVEEMVAADQHSEGGLVTISDATAREVSEVWWHATLVVGQEPSATVTSTGEIVEDFPDAKRYVMDLVVVQEEGQWRVREAEHSETS